MTLMQMKYAIAVADTKSMNEAARSLFITQPSLSASIKELENEIGVELFKRTNRGITVTPEGIFRLCQTGGGTVPPDRVQVH